MRPQPSADDLLRLIKDAMSVDSKRYGEQLLKTEQGFVTDTGVQIQLDWASLSLSQQGKDTELINNLYKAHYLQWTGQKTSRSGTGCDWVSAVDVDHSSGRQVTDPSSLKAL